MSASVLKQRVEDGQRLPLLVWTFAGRAAATASVGGGIGLKSWVINAQVSNDYQRHDLHAHAAELSSGLGLTGPGIALFTAADVTRVQRHREGGVEVEATVGLTHPTWAADIADSSTGEHQPGTINIVAFVPVRLAPGALLNALCTVTEAKAQALLRAGVPGTGTPSDAVAVICANTGAMERFCGPRSLWGARLARATFAAVRAGIPDP